MASKRRMEVEKIDQTRQLNHLLEQYEKLIFSICYQITGNYFDAEDLTQETFLSAYQSLATFDGQHERAWLTKIATNKCLDFLKRAGRRAQPSDTETLEQHSPPVASPESDCLSHLMEERLATLCRSLKPPYDQVALSYYCEDKTAKEIASQTGCKTKTVQTQIYRARSMLAKLWKKEDTR